ncbi:unnamed protein product [Rotaria sp. Silwood1]|nr:unnamed protein product [Rotaria sp. Silwood1]
MTYVDDIDIRTSVRKLMTLAVLPVDKVQVAFDDLCTNSSDNVKETLHQLFVYFENQWIEETPSSVWNAHGLQHRTNSICEGNLFLLFYIYSNSFIRFHNHLIHGIERLHPNIWSFIEGLHGKESRFRHMLIQMNAGAQGRPKTATTTAIQQCI